MGNSVPDGSSEYSGFVSSGVYQSGCSGPATSNRFRLVAHPSMLGVLGLFNVWLCGPADQEDMVISLWVVLRYIEEGYARQVLHHLDGVSRKKKHEACDVLAWWRENMCHHHVGPGLPSMGRRDCSVPAFLGGWRVPFLDSPELDAIVLVSC